MPELPEVETTCRGIKPYLLRQTIAKITIRNRQLRTLISPQLTQQLQLQQITDVTRRAKYILIHTTRGTLIIHLGMSGSLRVNTTTKKLNNTPVKKHDHVDFILDNGTTLHFNDPRRFGLIEYTNQDTKKHRLLAHLGAEPLASSTNSQQLYQAAQKTRTTIKTFIMNQRIIVGVGNIYASESLFKARIHPQQAANTLNSSEFTTLLKHIRSILNCSIEQGGTTLKDFSKPDGNLGYFQQSLFVYGRENKPCLTCKTIIKKITQCQRSTFYCPNCQSEL